MVTLADDPTTSDLLTDRQAAHARGVLHSVGSGSIPNDTRRGPFAPWRETMRSDQVGFARSGPGRIDAGRAPLLACEALSAADTADDFADAALSLAKLARSIEGDVGGRGDGLAPLTAGRWALAGLLDQDPGDLAALAALGLLAYASVRLGDLP